MKLAQIHCWEDGKSCLYFDDLGLIFKVNSRCKKGVLALYLCDVRKQTLRFPNSGDKN